MLKNYATQVLLIFFTLIFPTVAQADEYSVWADEVSNSGRGLIVCMESHLNSLVGNISEKVRANRKKDAKHTCALLKSSFDTTMLLVRTRVVDKRGVMSDFHEAVKTMFDDVTPAGQSALAYQVYLAKTKNKLGQFEVMMLTIMSAP